MSKYLSPSETRRLTSAMLAVVGFILLVAVFGFLVVPSLRYQANPDQGGPDGAGHVNPVLGETGWLDPTDAPPMKKQVIPPIDPASVMTPTPALLAQGRDLFGRECVSCHGPEGKGDGPGGLALNPRPRNFTAPEGWKNNYRLDGIYKTLDQGIPGSGMGSFSYLGRKERMALAHYVQSLGKFDHGGDPAASASLAHVFATSGETIPNRIPVRWAIDHLCREYAASHPSP